MLLKGSFEDILYILIGIIWVAFSIYQAKKRKKQKSESQPGEKKKKSFFETLIDEMTEQNQQQTDISNDKDSTIAEPVIKLDKDYEEEKYTYDDNYEEGNYNEVVDVISTTEPLTKQIPKHEQKSRLTKRKKIRFDLKKAVIYSEILKPKYF